MKNSWLTIFLIPVLFLLGGIVPSLAQGISHGHTLPHDEADITSAVVSHLFSGDSHAVIEANTTGYPKGSPTLVWLDVAGEEEESIDSEKHIRNGLALLQRYILTGLQSMWIDSFPLYHYDFTMEEILSTKKYLFVQVFRI